MKRVRYEKLKILVLSVGIMIIVVTCSYIIFSMICDYRTTGLDSVWARLILPAYFGLYFPLVLEEIMLLRSVYKLTILRPLKSAKICCIISMFILLVALVFQGLFFANIITEDILPDGPTAKGSRMIGLVLLTEWPVALLTGILTSVNSDEETQ